jgi:predicted permease
VFAGIAWVNAAAKNETRPGLGENPLTLTTMTDNALDVLRLRPAMGRAFDESDVAADTRRSVLLTYQTWQSRYRSSADVTDLSWVDGPLSYRVIGVLPKDFLLPSSRLFEGLDGVYAYRHRDHPQGVRGSLITAPFARLQPGVSLANARTVATTTLEGMPWEAADGQQSRERRSVQVEPLLAGMALLVREPMRLVFGAAGLVFAVTTVNLALLLSVWARARDRAVGIRLCLGASKARLARSAVIESLAICACGACLAWLGYACTQAALVSVIPPSLRSFVVFSTDTRLITASALAALAAGLACAIPPIRAAFATDLLAVLDRRRPGRSKSGAVGLLLASEAAIGIVLTITAAAAVPEFVRLRVQSPGYEPVDLHVIDVGHDWPGEQQSLRSNSAERVSAILESLGHVAGVKGAAASIPNPLASRQTSTGVWLDRGVSGGTAAVSGGFFAVVGLPILAGRSFSDDEVAANSLVAVVDEAGAKALWSVGPAEAIGRRVQTADGIRVVVGVVRNSRAHPGAAESPTLYVPVTATEASTTQSALPVVVRMESGRSPDARVLNAALRTRFPQGNLRLQSVEQSFDRWVETPRLLAVILGTFGGIALMLVAIAIVALVRFEIERRTYEMAIRFTLGASAMHVRWMLTRSFLLYLALGTSAGVLITLWLARLAESEIGINIQHPVPFLWALGLIAGATIGGAALPTARLGRAEPSSMLKR